jgi:hypothetical protein
MARKIELFIKLLENFLYEKNRLLYSRRINLKNVPFPRLREIMDDTQHIDYAQQLGETLYIGCPPGNQIMSTTGKNGLPYDIFVQQRKGVMSIQAYHEHENMHTLAAIVRAKVNHQAVEALRQGSQTELPLELPVYIAYFETAKRHRSQGLTRPLAQVLFTQFGLHGPILHVNCFSKMGRKRALHIFRDAGYLPIEFHPTARMPSWCRSHTNWVYKIH